MDKENKIKIVMADDHPIFRSGLRQIIEEDENIQILGEADNGQQALELVQKCKPDIALLDIDMPKKTGLEVLRELNELDVSPHVIFLTVYADEDMFDEAMELGIKGYVLKDSAISDIRECLYKVFENNYYISPSVTNFLINKKDRMKKFDHRGPDLESLTKSELVILRLISQGRTTKEIAASLEISYKTIENHRTNISNKLGLRGSSSLMTFAIENKNHLVQL